MARLCKVAVLGLPILAGVLLGCTNDWGAVDAPPTRSMPADPAPRLSRMQQPDSPPQVPASSVQPVSAPSLPNVSGPIPCQVRICAWVNGTPLFQGEMLNAALADLMTIRGRPEPEYSVQREKILKENLQHLIDQEVVYQDAIRKLAKSGSVLDRLKEAARKQFQTAIARFREKHKLTDVDYKKVLQAQGQTYESLARQEERKFIVSEYIRFRIIPILDQIGHEEILDYYRTHLNEFQTVDRVEWEDIFIEVGRKHPTLDQARQFGQQLVAGLNQGEPFVNLVKFDDGDSVTRKGQGYGNRRGEIRPPELEQYLFQMKSGQVGPVVEMPTGVHVFRLTKREQAGQLPFNAAVQNKIRTKLQNEIYRREFQRIVRQLAARTVIEVDADAFK